MPWQADWYRELVRANLGDKADAHFRLWYTDHALHGDDASNEDSTRVVSYQGALQQALRDLAAWVEQGVAPPATTNYRIDDGQVIVAGHGHGPSGHPARRVAACQRQRACRRGGGAARAFRGSHCGASRRRFDRGGGVGLRREGRLRGHVEGRAAVRRALPSRSSTCSTRLARTSPRCAARPSAKAIAPRRTRASPISAEFESS